MPLTLRYVALSDVGRVRSVNQDSGYASHRLLVVADGMGGAAAGDLASSEAMHVMVKVDADERATDDPVGALAGALHRANDRIAEIIEDDPMVEGMGTTVTALLFDGESFGMAHIGDSRAYRLRDGDLVQLTHDHTFVQSLVDEGRITAEESRHHPHRSVILRVLVGRDDSEPDLETIDARVGDRFLVCSDGLSGMITDEAIARLLGDEGLDLAAVELVRAALAAGGSDNITVVIGEVADDSEPIDTGAAAHDGHPMMVGSAADLPRTRPTRAAATGAPTAAAPGGVAEGESGAGAVPIPPPDQRSVDPEELRYAPQPPRRFGWLRRLLAVVVLLALVAVALRFAYGWTQDQYYVAESDGNVAIFRGIPESFPGVDLHSEVEVTDISLDVLPEVRRETVLAGIEADSLGRAEEIVEQIRGIADDCDNAANVDSEQCEGASPETPDGGAGNGGNGNTGGNGGTGGNQNGNEGTQGGDQGTGGAPTTGGRR